MINRLTASAVDDPIEDGLNFRYLNDVESYNRYRFATLRGFVVFRRHFFVPEFLAFGTAFWVCVTWVIVAAIARISHP